MTALSKTYSKHHFRSW